MSDANLEATRRGDAPIRSTRPGSVPPEVREAPPEASFGKFVRHVKLGEGGMGEVWKAWDGALGRWVALKFPHSVLESDLALFRREAETAGRLSHPNIAAVLEVGQANGRPYIAMPFVEGQTLRAFPPSDLKGLVRLIRDAARALAYAHLQGIVHRDIKPANLMFQRGPAGGLHVTVMDFGLARIATGDGRSLTGGAVGTLGFMAPEQARAQPVDGRADVYSLGATLYEALSGAPPIRGATVYEYVTRVQSEEPPALPGIDRDLEKIVMKCLEKEPARRYEGAERLAEDLDLWLEGEPVRARPIGPLGRLARRGRRHPRTVAALGLLAAAAAVLVAVILHRAAAERARFQTRQNALRLVAESSALAAQARASYHQYGGKFAAFREALLAAEARAEEAARTDPGLAAARDAEGSCWHDAAEPVKAREAFESALRIDPADATAHAALAEIELEHATLTTGVVGNDWGETLHARACLDRAVAHLAKAGASDAVNPDLHARLEGLTLLAAGKRDEALSVFRDAAEKLPRPGPLWEYAAIAAIWGMSALPDKAKECAKKAMELMPRDSRAMYIGAMAAETTRDVPEALRLLGACLDRNPREAAAWFRRGWLRYRAVYQWKLPEGQTTEQWNALWRETIPKIEDDFRMARSLDPNPAFMIAITDFHYILAFQDFADGPPCDLARFDRVFEDYAVFARGLPELPRFDGGAHYFCALAIERDGAGDLASRLPAIERHLDASVASLRSALPGEPGPNTAYIARSEFNRTRIRRAAGVIDDAAAAKAWEALLPEVDRAEKLGPPHALFPVLRSRILAAIGRREDAIKALEAAIADPGYAEESGPARTELDRFRAPK